MIKIVRVSERFKKGTQNFQEFDTGCVRFGTIESLDVFLGEFLLKKTKVTKKINRAAVFGIFINSKSFLIKTSKFYSN
jgi:hypothetical protein